MAVSNKSFIGTVVTVVTAGTPVQPPTPVPQNCHTLIIYNPNVAATILVGFAQNAAGFVAASAVRVPAGTSSTLAIGPESQRPASPGDVLFVDATLNGSSANIAYVNGMSL